MIRLHPRFGLPVAMLLLASAICHAAEDSRLKCLFLGDQGHHQPARRAAELLPVLAERGIDVQYTDDVADALRLDRLKQFDGLIVYANIDQIADDQAAALLNYVDQGGGFVPLHCASYCFRNNPEIVALIGAQFQRHGTGTFTVAPTDQGSQHPILEGYRSFESWDETYVHTLHNESNRTVLEYRQEGDSKEPWTWVRTHGKGRVFYTAWGHDTRTFTNPGFQNLVERGIRWACGDDPAKAGEFVGVQREPLADIEMTPLSTDVAPFEYIDVGPKIPNYVASQRWGEQETPRNMMQKPLDPAESMKHYVVPQGFELQLYASEPDLEGKPICMTWDSRGRLWVAETYDYPNELQREGEGRDRIRICEDTDGDHRADKFTVFADKLSIPTSILVSHGGLIVHQAPHTLFLKDTDGDDVADVRKVLFTGWSTGDTHAGPSNLRYGHDNWIYGMVGYAGFEGQIAGQRRSFRTGFYRFKVQMLDGELEVTDFEFLRNTNNNSWGVGLSEEGLLFGSTANRNPSEFMPVANRHYERVRGWTSTVLSGIADTHLFKPITDKVRQVDHHGGYTAAAGHALYTARRYPKAYWNRTAFVAGPTGHLVGTFVLKPTGAGFSSTSPANLVASNDEWAAPIMAEVGPDGNVWVIDWYNYIVQHNPTPVGFETGRGNAYETDLRDKKHGRVYRVVYPQDAPSKSLSTESTSDLVAALTSDNMFWRLHAQRLLVERGDRSVAPKLLALARRTQLDEIGLDVGALHALWTLDGLGMFGADGEYREALVGALGHPSSAVARAAVTMMPRDAAGRDAIIQSDAAGSTDAQVRLAALLALAETPPSAESASVALAALTSVVNANDRWILDAATSAAATSASEFLTLAANRSNVTDALIERAEIVAEHMARNEDAEATAAVIRSLAGADARLRDAIVRGWSEGWPKASEAKLDAAADEQLLALFDALSPGAKGQLIRLAQVWGSEKLTNNAKMIANSLMKIATDEDVDGDQRVQAASELIGLMDRDLEVAAELLESISPRMPQATAAGFLQALRRSRADGIGEVILEQMARFTPSARQEALRVMLARPDTTSDLLDAMAAKKIASQDLALDQQQALLAHPDRDIRNRAREVLSQAGGLPSPDREKVLTSLMKVTGQTGDVERGKVVFTKNCANCHMHRGEGNKVGPDLTGMAVHPKAELLTHILDPSRSVEGNYRSYSVLTLDGIVVNGMLASETQTAIEIFDSQGKKQVVLREDIEQLVASTKSVMPEGFEKQIDEQGLTDLLEFLTDKGKYLPLPLDKVATAVSTKGLFHTGDDGPDRMVFADWSPKMVGEIPFLLIDPQGKRIPNIVLLNGPQGTMPPKMPRSVEVPCNAPIAKLYLLSGVSGWGFPAHRARSVSMIVRLHRQDGTTEDHSLINGVHFADYIRRVDVPDSQFAMMVGGQQLRLITIEPETDQVIERIELVKGDDPTAPIVVALTAEIKQK
jgi:putative membrane-bound dehydrogenase-like protein